jgi:hypothetical protein
MLKFLISAVRCLSTVVEPLPHDPKFGSSNPTESGAVTTLPLPLAYASKSSNKIVE